MKHNKMMQKENMSQGVSRRDVLKGAAFAGLGVLGASALSACSPNSGDSDKQAPNTTAADISWDKEVDILVAGTGTVIYAAIAAAEMGSDSIFVVEKDSAMFGGTSATSGGGHALAMLDVNADEGINDTRDQVLEYLRNVGDSRMDENVQAAFVDNANAFSHFVLDTFGWLKWGHINKAFGDYYELYPGSLSGAFGHGSWYPWASETEPLMAPAQWSAYREYVDSSEVIELSMGSSIDSLIVDDEGAVIGAIVNEGSKEIRVKANAVVLGTGGFEHDENMRRFYLPFPYYRSNGSMNNTGDAHRMGAQIGAQLAYMDTTFGNPYFDTDTEFNEGVFRYDSVGSDAFAPRGFPHSIMVNHKGNRFCDESTMYDTMNRAFGQYDTGSMEYVNIPGYWICDGNYINTFFLPGSKEGEIPDFVSQFDSLEALADGMGIDKEALIAEVAAFNENAAAGTDPKFGRGAKEASTNTLEMMATYRLQPGAEAPTSVLGVVDTAPFYCVRYLPGMMGGTRGGLHINENSQVLNVLGEAIGGLYAVGNCSSGVAGYWAGGATLGQGAVMGYVAAKHITGNAS